MSSRAELAALAGVPEPRCSDCGTALGELNVDRTGDILCRADYLKRYPGETLPDDDLVIVDPPGDEPPPPLRNGQGPAARFTVRGVDLTRLQPVRFAWRPWLVHGRLNLMPGEEAIGKSTLQSWIVSEATRGRLDGELKDRPARVLWVGADEDDWYEVVTPRLYAMGADLSRIHGFIPVADSAVFDVVAHIGELDRELQDGKFDLVVFEQLLDVLPAMKNNTDPVEVRRALRPLRRCLAARSVTGLGTLHVNKAQADQLRQRMQGSMQFNALARSTILVDRHPEDEHRRIAVLGKANYVAGPVALSFRIENHRFDLNGKEFNVGRVADVRDDDTPISDVLDRAVVRHRRAANTATR